jgi:hypothetical protein
MAELLRFELVVPRESIYYMSWTIDAYEGLGFLRTDDSARGLVSILFPSCLRQEIERLLDAFGAEGIEIHRRGVYPEQLIGVSLEPEKLNDIDLED